MISEHARPWPWWKNGDPVTTKTLSPRRFIAQYLRPLLFWRTYADSSSRGSGDITSEEQFWHEAGNPIFGTVKLTGFRLTDWFPRVPGIYWSRQAQKVREEVYSVGFFTDPELGNYVLPGLKMNLIEEGGIGTIRLRPRKIDDEECWLATAMTGTECHSGIPLAIPRSILRKAGVRWGDRVNLRGQIRFLQDAGLDDIADRVHHSHPLIVFVDELKGVITRRSHE